ncbi:MAG: hypothetical protein RIS94_1290 [Pseudomonadota bacterium]
MARMRHGIAVALLAGAVALGGAAQAKPRLTGEEQLAKLLEGREAGAPVDCISTLANSSSQVIDKTAIVFGSGRTIYVQRPKSGAEQLDDDDVLVTRLNGPQLCSIDVIQLHDRSSLHMWRGFVGLDKFVPYTRKAH